MKTIYKTNTGIFSEYIITLSKEDINFTLQACNDITKYIDDISYYDDSELFKLTNSIIPLLNLKDEFQMTRFNIIIGYPQIIVDEPNSRSAMPYFGFHNMSESHTKIHEYKGLINSMTSCCLMKKLTSLKNHDKAQIEIFLLLLDVCEENHELLKYIRHMNYEEAYYDDFINWGVTLINNYETRHDNPYFKNLLKTIVEKLNPVLTNVTNMNAILPSFKSFYGKYLHKDIKLERFTLVHVHEAFMIIQVDYFTNTIEYTKDMDFKKSKSYYSHSQSYWEEEKNETIKSQEIDEENIYANSENVEVYEVSEKPTVEREWLRKITSDLIANKTVLVYNKNKVENFAHNLIRFIGFNSKIN